MRSVVAATKEIDDPALAARELAQSVRAGLTLLKNSCGILYFDYEADGGALAEALERDLGFPVIGCSAIATLDGTDGYHEMEAVLTVMTADDCEFSVELTAPLHGEASGESVIGAYHRAVARLTTQPKAVFVLCPAGTDAMSENNLAALTQETGSLPILGGIPYTAEDDAGAIVRGGGTTGGQAVLLVIGGNLRPVYALSNAVTRFADRQGTVTRADKDTIYEVDGAPFTEFLAGYGYGISRMAENLADIFYYSYPLLETSTRNDDGAPLVRILRELDRKQGSGRAFADFPSGQSTITLGVLRREDVRQTAEDGLRRLLGRMAQNSADGYEYSTVLCVSCAARHKIMNPYYADEGSIIRDSLPKGLSLSGFYGHGELCPASTRDGKVCTCLHNGAIEFCAF